MATRDDLLLDLGQLEMQRGQALLTVNAVTGAIQYVRQKIAELDAAGVVDAAKNATAPSSQPAPDPAAP